MNTTPGASTGSSRSALCTLIVDDSAYARRRLRQFLAELGLGVVFEAAGGKEAFQLFAEHRPRLVLLDQVMREQTGIELARKMLELCPGTRIVMFTVVSDPAFRDVARRCGVHSVLTKTQWTDLRAVLEEELDG